MTTTVLVYGEDAPVDGLPAGMPVAKYDGVLDAQDSNSDSWAAEPHLLVVTPRRQSRLMVVVTDEPVEFVVTYRNQLPDSVVSVPVRPATNGKGTYSMMLRAGHAKVWLRRIDA